MSPFAIFAIVLTIGYVFYFGIVIAHDLYGKKGQENTNEEHFDVSSMQDTEESTQVDEDGDSFHIGNESTSENSPNKEINNTDNNQTATDNTPEEEPQESIAAKKIAHLEENMEETMPGSSYAISRSELHKALLSGEVSKANGIEIKKVIVIDKM
jgi:uncharacterized protein YwqG